MFFDSLEVVMEEEKLKFALTVEQTNIILDALSHAPYKQVFELISYLQQTAQSQLQATVSKSETPRSVNTSFPQDSDIRGGDVSSRHSSEPDPVR